MNLLGDTDLNTELYLVANVMRVGKITFSESSMRKGDKNNTTQSQYYRRPFGVGILPLTDLKQFDTSIEPEEREYNFKIQHSSCFARVTKESCIENVTDTLE